jgi:hypothetical protein
MINLSKLNDSKIEMYRQLYRGQISETALIARMEVKDEQMALELKRLSALFCASCEKIGMPDSIDLTVELGAARDE